MNIVFAHCTINSSYIRKIDIIPFKEKSGYMCRKFLGLSWSWVKWVGVEKVSSWIDSCGALGWRRRDGVAGPGIVSRRWLTLLGYFRDVHLKFHSSFTRHQYSIHLCTWIIPIINYSDWLDLLTSNRFVESLLIDRKPELFSRAFLLR
jgi:hypothetical protein